MSLVNETVFQNYIDGQWVNAQSGQTVKNGNPADTNDVVGYFQASEAVDAEAAIRAAEAAFASWKNTPIAKRASVLEKAADYLEQNVEEIAQGLTEEEGKTLAQSKGEVLRSAQTLRFYAVEGQTYTGETFPQDDPNMTVYTYREPLGVVTVIAPWNFPISIPARKIAPALITGNTVVFKPSSETPLTGYYLTKAFAEAGVPAGVFNFITGRASAVGSVLVESAPVKAISFTGSTNAGEQIARAARMTTRLQMELGGKNPLIVMEDADLDHAANLVVQGGFGLSGQACTGTSRVLVHKDVKTEFVEKLLAKVGALRIGPGMENHDLGPIATESQMKSILKYIEIGKSEANCIYGGEQLTDGVYSNGFYVQPTIFSDVTQDMVIAKEEIFGPVIAIIDIENYEDALQKANDTEYGLSASIVTKNPTYAHRFVRDIESGTVKINRTTTGNLVNAPFGGLKRSSTATFRESGRVGLEFYTQVKTVYQGI